MVVVFFPNLFPWEWTFTTLLTILVDTVFNFYTFGLTWHFTLSGAVVRRLGWLWNAWITKEACFVIWEVRYECLTATCQSGVQSPVLAELATCLSKSKCSISETPRGIPEHCPVRFYFLFKSVVGTPSQFLLQVCCTFFNGQLDLHLTWFPFPCLQHPWFPSVLCWGGKGALAGQVRGKQEPASRLAWESLNFRASSADRNLELEGEWAGQDHETCFTNKASNIAVLLFWCHLV